MADVKRWIHDAYAMHMTTRDSRGGDPVSGRLYGMARAVWMGKVMAAVENQPKPYGALLQFLYAPTYTEAQFRTLTKAALGGALRNQKEKVQARTFDKLAGLAQVALLDYQRQQRGRDPFLTKEILLMANIDEANWYKPDRRWRRWYDAMGRALHRMELEALEQPRRVVEEIEENERASA